MYYFFVGYYNGTINRRIEKFTSLNGLNPLTTYDDYGTFNFILQTDDFPYYDSTYEELGCCYKTGIKNKTPKGPLCKSQIRDYDKDVFFNFEEDKVRKFLPGANYSDHRDLGSAIFGDSQLFVNLFNPKLSSQPPEPFNWEFPELLAELPDSKHDPQYRLTTESNNKSDHIKKLSNQENPSDY